MLPLNKQKSTKLREAVSYQPQSQAQLQPEPTPITLADKGEARLAGIPAALIDLEDSLNTTMHLVNELHERLSTVRTDGPMETHPSDADSPELPLIWKRLHEHTIKVQCINHTLRYNISNLEV